MPRNPMVRRNCPECRVPSEPTGLARAALPEELVRSGTFRRGQGCGRCHHTGFAGRVLVTELLTTEEPLREAVLRKLPSRELHRVAVAEGMSSLWRTGLRRVASGDVAVEELARVVTPEST